MRKDKSLSLKQASNQLQQKVAPVVAARPDEHANSNQLSDDQIDAAAEGEAKGDS